MTGLQEPVAEEIKTLPALVWNEIKVALWDTQLTRENFLDRLTNKQLDVPMAICALGESEESEIGSIDSISKRVRVSIYYVMSKAGQTDVSLVGLAKAEAMLGLLEKPGVVAAGAYSKNTFNSFHIIEDPEVNMSQENPVNTFMAEQGFPYAASQCRFYAYYGTAYGVWS